ncbi:MAG: EamA family transporter [Patescibacteria group bacterium]
MIWLPFVATALFTLSMLQRKQFLRESRLPFSDFFPSLLLLIAGMSLVAAPFDWSVDASRATAPLTILLLVIVSVLGMLWFEHFYRAIREESLSRFDFLAVLDPLVTIAFVSLLFPAERNVHVWAATSVACVALYFGHKNHHAIQFDHGERNLLVGIGLSAVIVAIDRYLLTIYSPLAFNAIYMCGIALLFVLRYGWGSLQAGYRLFLPLTLTAALIVANTILFFYSYRELGVTVTTLVALLQPVAIGFIAYFIYKEPVKPKLLLAGVVVLLAVLYAVLRVSTR